MNGARVLASTLLLLVASVWLQPVGAAQTQSLTALKQQAATGNAKAEFALGKRLADSKNASDKAKSTTWFRKAAKQGNVDAEWRLGVALIFGIGVPKDMSAGLASMHKSLLAKQPVQRMLIFGWAKVLWGGSIQSAQDVHEGAKWVRRAAQAGSAKAMSFMGVMQLLGHMGVAQDKAAGMRWLQKAAHLGNTNAQALLGKAYILGLAPHADVKQGMHWLRKAATHGEVSAEGLLGYLLVTGDKHVPKDAAKGVHWATEAATKGNARAYYTLGLAYQQGAGEPVDAAKAYFNFAAAQHLTTNKQSRQHASEHMSAVAGQLSAAQLKQIQARVAKIPVPKKKH